MSTQAKNAGNAGNARNAGPGRVYLYKRYERFWHWSQAVLIGLMMLTGFEVHGSYALLGYGQAVSWHTACAWALLVLWAFTIFWQFTTGEWRQYRPSLHNVVGMARYYTIGIFKEVPHPFRPSTQQKHNPLQRLTYLLLLACILPLIWASGLLYLFYADWPQLGLAPWLTLEGVALAHTVGAYLIVAFFFAHVYLTTTGHTVFSHIKAMLTGWEELH
ncbi:MAG: cytochrome b/b6 domain-containing protein [Sterolibacterium sp.]|nr:cytochrome b/b6 domain-containing protein [Sterolibacterium sp.]